MCTQHRTYFRKVLIEKTFADNFSFQLYPTAKIRLRFKSPCTKSAQSLPTHRARPPAPRSLHRDTTEFEQEGVLSVGRQCAMPLFLSTHEPV